MVQRGFFCDDASINYPYKQETIDLKTLMFIALILPGLIINICDRFLCKLLTNSAYQVSDAGFTKKRRKASDNSEIVHDSEEEQVMISRPNLITRRNPVINEDVDERSSNTTRLGFRRINILNRAFGEFQFFFFGFSTTMLFTGIGKITCGRFRPHFMQRCQPDVDCASLVNANKYIEVFTCSNSQLGSRGLSYIMTSWPSGHASVMFYSMFYLAIYLNTVIPAIVQLSSLRVKRGFDPLILYAIYVLMLSLAGYIALTRVSDYHHHPLDVFSGSVIGSLIAIALAKSLSRPHLQVEIAGSAMARIT